MIEFLSNLLAGIPANYTVLFELGIILVVAGVLALLIKLLRQPLIPAYILAGIIVGPLVLGLISNNSIVFSLSEIGVAFLLFYAGLEISFKKLKETGKIAGLAGLIQVVGLLALGFFASLLIGFLTVEALYIGLVVAFSSTMIVVKLLADKQQLNTLHGRITLGILLIQDIAAILALTFISGSGELSIMFILVSLLKLGFFVVIAYILAKLSNYIFEIAARSTELVFLVSIAFLFLFSMVSYFAGLSIVIGAFFAGLALSNSKFKVEIQGGISSIRDFFAVIFFVALGIQLTLFPLYLLYLFFVPLILTLIFKPLAVMIVMKLFSYKRRVSFLTGVSLAQTSEFSLIILGQGLILGHISQELFSMLVLLTIVSMSLTTYVLRYASFLSNIFSPLLNLFGKENDEEELESIPTKKNKIVIFGCHRMGSLFLDEFSGMKKSILVVDFNPDIIKALMRKKVSCIYGDFANREVLEKANLESAEIVITTIPGLEDNLLLIKKVKEKNKKAVIFVSADRISHAEALYKAGADYVILPQVIGGRKSAELMKAVLKDRKKAKPIKTDAVKYIKRIHHLLYG